VGNVSRGKCQQYEFGEGLDQGFALGKLFSVCGVLLFCLMDSPIEPVGRRTTWYPPLQSGLSPLFEGRYYCPISSLDLCHHFGEVNTHHILPVSEFNTKLAQKLRGWGIDLNGAANGVLLPTSDYAGRVASIHRGGHLEAYAQEVRRLLGAARSRDDALSILSRIRDRLLDGTLVLNGAQ
jgi:hypothetical protein